MRRGRQLEVTVRWAGVNQPAVRVPVGRQHLTDHELDAGLAQAGAIDGAGGVPGGAG